METAYRKIEYRFYEKGGTLMCDENNKCKEQPCDSTFKTKDDLIRYRDWLKHELAVVEKTLQDLQEEID